MFIELGMGVDLHGQDVTKAAVRAVQNAIHRNSMPGLRSVLPGNTLQNMKVNVRLAVPADKVAGFDGLHATTSTTIARKSAAK